MFIDEYLVVQTKQIISVSKFSDRSGYNLAELVGIYSRHPDIRFLLAVLYIASYSSANVPISLSDTFHASGIKCIKMNLEKAIHSAEIYDFKPDNQNDSNSYCPIYGQKCGYKTS